MVDILSIQPNKIDKSLKGKYIMLYSQPKGGKTTFASQFPNTLLCAFEIGYHALPGVKAIDIKTWGDFKTVVQQLRSPQAKETYNTIAIDTYQIAVDLCEKYVLIQNDADSLGDIPWGQGWTIFKKELDSTFREITQLGYGIVFIAHSKEKATDKEDKDGNPIMKVFPDITKTGLAVANKLVDIVAYLSVEFQPDGTSKRYLYTRETPYVFAGSRYKYLSPKIEFGYDELIEAISEAIDKEDKERKNSGHPAAEQKKEMPTLSYDELTKEAKELWTALIANNNFENVEKIKESIKKHFGKEIKLSEIKTEDVQLLSYVVDDMRQM